MIKLTPTTKYDWTISNRLYFGSYAVRKKIISASFKHPLLKKEVLHRFHVGELEKRPVPQDFKKDLRGFKNGSVLTINKSDLNHELNLFVSNPQKQPIYFFFEVCDGPKTLPLYYAPFYTRDCFPEEDPAVSKDYETVPKWLEYLRACHEVLSSYVYEETLHPSYYYDLFSFFHDFGFSLYEWLDRENPEYIDEPIDPKNLDRCKRQFERTKDPAMRSYALVVLDSIFKQMYSTKSLMKCDFCERFISYQKGKRYCSLKTEKRDCAKKARNKRYYAQKGCQQLDSYRKRTKDLRIFYREKQITK